MGVCKFGVLIYAIVKEAPKGTTQKLNGQGFNRESGILAFDSAHLVEHSNISKQVRLNLRIDSSRTPEMFNTRIEFFQTLKRRAKKFGQFRVNRF